MAEFCNNCLIEIEVYALKKWVKAGKGDQQCYPEIPGWPTVNEELANWERIIKGGKFQGECAGRVTEKDVKLGKYGIVLCERCDFTLVDEKGNCLTDCEYKHGTIVITGRPGRTK